MADSGLCSYIERKEKLLTVRKGISQVTVMGAGLSGLTLAWKCQEAGLQTLVLEAQEQVGGVIKSPIWKGFRFDLGPESFYTTEEPLHSQFQALMGPAREFRQRQHRIWFHNRWIAYPLNARSLFQVPPRTLLQAMQDYFLLLGRSQFQQPAPEQPSLVDAFPQYGEVLDRLLMSNYLYKIRRHPASSLRPSWSMSPERAPAMLDAVQRMAKGLFVKAEPQTKTFHDPARGFGSLTIEMRKAIERLGGEVKTGVSIRQISAPNGEVTSIDYCHNRREYSQKTDYVFSTIPVPTLLTLLEPLAPHALIESSLHLNHHVMVFLCVLLRRPPEQSEWWSYFPEQDVPFFRVSHAVAHQPMQTQPQHQTCLLIEWMLSPNDPLSQASADELFQAAIPGLQRAGFPVGPVQDVMVHRERQAVPLATTRSQQTMRNISSYLTSIQRLRSVGQRGTFTPSQFSESLQDAMKDASQLIQEAQRIEEQRLSGATLEEG